MGTMPNLWYSNAEKSWCELKAVVFLSLYLAIENNDCYLTLNAVSSFWDTP